MIRRNFIETRSKIDRQSLKLRSTQPKENSASSKNQSNQLQGNRWRDQNMWMGSNNSKYQKYKMDREQRPKIQEFKVQNKPNTLPLYNLQSKQHDYNYKQDNLLRRQYTYDLGDTLKIDYNSISLKPNRYTKNQSNNYLNRNLQAKTQQNNDTIRQNKLNQNNFDATIALSPAKNYSIPKYTPLFQQNDMNCNKKSIDSHIKSEAGIPSYNQRPSQIVKRSQQQSRYYSKAKQTNQAELLDNANKSQYSSVVEKPSASRCSFNAPTLPPTYHKQQVSQKLKMISDFNDQINERIKNIIGCFQGLKNKL